MTILHRYALLAVGGGLVSVSIACILTPVLWNLEGNSSESYPELAALAFLLPASLLVFAAGLCRALSRRPWRPRAVAIFWVAVIAAIAHWTLLFVFLAGWSPTRAGVLALIVDLMWHNFYVALLVYALMVATAWLVRKER